MAKKTLYRFQIVGGFTLIELLLGIIIFSLIAVSFYGTLITGMRLSQRVGGSEHFDYRQMCLVFDLFTKEVENAISYDFSRSYPGYFSFSGNKESITFLKGEDGKIKVVRYALAPASENAVHKTLVAGFYPKNIKVTERRHQIKFEMDFVREEMNFTDYITSGFKMIGDKEILIKNLEKEGLRFSYAARDEKQPAGPEGDQEINSKIDTQQEPSLFESWQSSRPPVSVTLALKVFNGQEQKDLVFYRKVFVPQGFALRRKKS